jgi:hypothetical protein
MTRDFIKSAIRIVACTSLGIGAGLVGPLPAAALPASTQPASTQPIVVESKELRLTVKLPPDFHAGTANMVEATIENRTDAPIHFWSYPNRCGFYYKLTFDNKQVPKSAWGIEHFADDIEYEEMWKVRHPGQSHLVSSNAQYLNALRPGDPLTIRMNLTRFFDLSQSGDYELTVSWSSMTFPGKPAGPTLETKPIKFHVLDDDKNGWLNAQ